MKAFLRVLFCVLVAVSATYAQSITGTLTGTVSDPSGGVIPSANVTFTNTQSGDVRRTVTNAEGYFTVAAVPAGTYDLEVDVTGFQKYKQTGIVFYGADKRNVDVQMQLQQAAQQLEVISSQDVLTPVDSGEKADVLNTRQLQDFSVVGRSAAEFIKIMPGMAQSGNGVTNRAGFDGQVLGINGNGDAGHQSALGYYSANGTPTNSMEITADGSHVSDPGCNCATPVNPNTDMIQEMKVQTSNFSAEYSKGPVVINTIAKAGTRDYHGMGYLYARHFGMNSQDWLDNARSINKPENQYYFPGFNLGGPVLLPKTNFNRNRDKLFFFTGYEYYYQKLDTGQVTASVPTADLRAGNFSPAAIAKLGTAGTVPGNPQPINSAQFPTGQIPQNLWDKGGSTMLNLYPQPNADPFATGGYNYVKKVEFNQNSYQWLTRVDYSISDNTKLFVRYNLQNELQRFPIMLWWRANPGDQVPYPTGIDSPNQSQSVSSDLTHVFSPTLTNEFVFGYTYINFPNRFADPAAIDRTALGYPYQGIFHNGIKQIPNIVNWGNQTAFIYNVGGFEAGDGNLFAIKHLATFSDNVSKVFSTHTLKAGAYFEYVINNQPANGNVQGDLTFDTGNSLTSGNAYADMLLGRVNGFSQNNFNPLHNEAYKLFEVYVQDSWKVTRRLTLDLGIRFSHLGQWYDREGRGFAVWNPSTYTSDQTAYWPGITWNKRDSSIPMSGYPTQALFYAPRFGMAWDMRGNGATVLRGGFGAFRYHTPQSTDGLDVPTGSFGSSIPNPMDLSKVDLINTPTQSTYQSSPALVNRTADDMPVTYSYSFTISQRIREAAMFEIAYVGNQTRHLDENSFHNLNAVPYGTLLSLADPGGANYSQYRPMSYYQDINIHYPDAYANYHSLQTSFKQQRGRFDYMLNYTWSKAMGIQGGSGITSPAVPDKLHMDQNYGPLPFDRRHIFNAAYSVNVGNVIKDNRFLRGVINEWQISGITQFQSGTNLQWNTGNGNFSLSGFNSRVINGTDSIQVQPRLICDPTSNLKSHQYINAACFAPPTPGNNGPISMPEMFGPSFFTTDLSLFKNFSITERHKLQFRFSGYNFLNHPLYTFGADSNLNLSFDSSGKVANPNFGMATNKIGRRIIQLAVKYSF